VIPDPPFPHLQENKNLSVPLAEAVTDVAKLQGELKDREKDRLSLRNAKVTHAAPRVSARD
jgi:hypothetical protein